MSETRSLLDLINQLIDSEQLSLPVWNQVSVQLQQLCAQDDFNAAEVERLVTSDAALAAEVLRSANSPFFGGLTTIGTIRGAIVRLGMDQVKRLAFMAAQRDQYCARDPQLMKMLQTLWRHAGAAAMAAQWLAGRLRLRHLQEECFLGGLLHDIGQLLILRAIDELGRSQSFPISLSLVGEVLRTAHSQMGYNLLCRWNIPETYCRIAKLHHALKIDATDVALVVVRLANEANRKAGTGLDPDPSLALGATPEAHILKASDIVLAELEVMLEDHLATAA